MRVGLQAVQVSLSPVTHGHAKKIYPLVKLTPSPDEIRMRLIIMAHSNVYHRTFEVTNEGSKKNFFWVQPSGNEK